MTFKAGDRVALSSKALDELRYTGLKHGMSACVKFHQTLMMKGVTAYCGRCWDGTKHHRDPSFWYFYPRENGGVGVHVVYDGTYDHGWIEPDQLQVVEAALARLPEAPTREAIWVAMEDFVVKPLVDVRETHRESRP